MNHLISVTKPAWRGTENAVLTHVSRPADTARMRKAWTPPWPWVFGIATGLSIFSWLQAWRLTLVNSKPGTVIHPEKLLALNLAYWYVPALLMPGTTISSAIANEFNEAVGTHRSALIALGFLLFVVTFVVLLIARLMLRRLSQREGR